MFAFGHLVFQGETLYPSVFVFWKKQTPLILSNFFSTEEAAMTKTIDISEEDKETEATINDELRLDTGDIIVTNDNDILKIFAEVAASDDLIATQRVIIAYEFGSGPLFRVLGRISELGEAITTSKPALVAEAFKQLRSQLTDEIKLSGVEKRPNKGIKGIGVPTIPVADQKFLKS